MLTATRLCAVLNLTCVHCLLSHASLGSSVDLPYDLVYACTVQCHARCSGKFAIRRHAYFAIGKYDCLQFATKGTVDKCSNHRLINAHCCTAAVPTAAYQCPLLHFRCAHCCVSMPTAAPPPCPLLHTSLLLLCSLLRNNAHCCTSAVLTVRRRPRHGRQQGVLHAQLSFCHHVCSLHNGACVHCSICNAAELVRCSTKLDSLQYAKQQLVCIMQCLQCMREQ